MGTKSVTKKKAKRASAKESAKTTAKAPVNVAEVRERVLQVIAEKAEGMTKANADEASKGHMAQLKYLFELLGIFPAAVSTEQEAEESNDLARVLLKRLEFPYKGPADEESEEGTKEAVPAEVKDDSVE
jgi:hypothetical protein